MEYLTCSKCKRDLSLNNFHRNTKSKTGRDTRCKDCISSLKASRYKQKNKRGATSRVLPVSTYVFIEVVDDSKPGAFDDFAKEWVEQVEIGAV